MSSTIVSYSDPNKDFQEFRPVQYIRIPLKVNKKLKKARIYMTTHGVYQREINGRRYDDRWWCGRVGGSGDSCQFGTR